MKKVFTFSEAFLVTLSIIVLLFLSIFMLKVEPHIPLIVSIIVLILFGIKKGYSYEQLEKALMDGISYGLKPILILMVIGMLISAWMMSGTVPTLMYIGFETISPTYFTLSVLLVTILVSTFTGSSFTTISTVGVALMGIAAGLGINPALAAGAVVSGAAFGDKMSPLSDTTNFAPGIVGVDLFTHIRHLLYTTVPALLITALLYWLIGIDTAGSSAATSMKDVKETLTTHFTISYWTLLSPLFVIFLAVKRIPTVVTIIFGIFSALLTTFFVQGSMSLHTMISYLQKGYQLTTGNEIVDGIVNRGGLLNMMPSVALIMIALAFGGLLRELQIIQTLIEKLTEHLQKRGHLIASTALSAIGVNILTGEQYLSILLPGQTFKEYYEKAGLQLKNLSRTLEDAGTLVNPLIPWGVSGAFFAHTLSVPVVEYALFAFFLTLSPLLTILFGYIGFSVNSVNKKDTQ